MQDRGIHPEIIMGTLNEKYYEFKQSNEQNPSNDIVKAPPQAAKGDDELMSQPQSQQQQQGMPGMDELKGKWKQHVGSAKIAWGKLTEDELLKSEGHAQRLTGLVQERYAISRDEADKQVKSFMEKHKL
jgi:uncharacterized protein YjbJ (UPF0337 family)